MEEILFRAKRVDNGELVEGDLIHLCNGMVIYYGSNTDAEIKPNIGACIEFFSNEVSVIIPKTLCQFTGVLDKNKIKVFENDKVLVHENVWGEIKDWTAKVVFIAGSFCLVNEDGNPICNLGDVCGSFEVIHE